MDVIAGLEKLSAKEFDAFELWCWRRLLRVPWTAKRYNQSILKEISPDYSLDLYNIFYSVGEGNGNPLQYSCLENPMAGGAWWAAVHGVAKSRTRLSDFTFTFHFHALEKEMATHSNVLAWKIPGTG